MTELLSASPILTGSGAECNSGDEGVSYVGRASVTGTGGFKMGLRRDISEETAASRAVNSGQQAQPTHSEGAGEGKRKWRMARGVILQVARRLYVEFL